MSDPSIVGSNCIIVVANLFEKINSQRKLLHKPPIENQAMASRLTLRFNVDKQRGVDFSADEILIEPGEIDLLEKTINELFGLYFEDMVSRMCVAPKVPEPTPMSVDSDISDIVTGLELEPEKTGMFSKLKRLFGGR